VANDVRPFRAVAVALALLASAPSARAQKSAVAPDKAACVSAFDRGQRAQSDRALRRALTDLIVCSQESCPTVLRADCAGVLAEVRSALPTIVFAADDGNGHELTDVKVYAGKEMLVSQLDGHAVAVDPGTFELRFEREGRPPLVTSRTIREGEKSRVIRVSLGGSPGAAGAAGATTRLPGPASSHRDPAGDLAPAPPRSTVGWVLPASLAGVGVAAAGVALFTRLSFDSRVAELRRSCAPECSQGERSDLSGTLVTSNVALGVGVGALALAVVAWIVTTPSSGASTGPSAAVSSPRGLAW
jgi:hypothetical protein